MNKVETALKNNNKKAQAQIRLYEAEEERLLTEANAETAKASKHDFKKRIDAIKQGCSNDNMTDHTKKDLEKLQQELSDADELLKQESTKRDQLLTEITNLKATILDCDFSVSGRDLVVLMQKINQCTKSMQSIEALIAENGVTVEAHQAVTANLNNLYGQRDDLRAEVALGEKTTGDLEQLDTKIALCKQEVDKFADNANTARYLIQGLQKKLPPLQSELAKLVGLKAPMILEYVKGEAQSLISQYNKQAEKTIALFQHLHLLNQFITNELHGAPIIGNQHLMMRIPSFSLQESSQVIGAQQLLFSHTEVMDHGGYVGLRVKVKDALCEMGILQ